MNTEREIRALYADLGLTAECRGQPSCRENRKWVGRICHCAPTMAEITGHLDKVKTELRDAKIQQLESELAANEYLLTLPTFGQMGMEHKHPLVKCEDLNFIPRNEPTLPEFEHLTGYTAIWPKILDEDGDLCGVIPVYVVESDHDYKCVQWRLADDPPGKLNVLQGEKYSPKWVHGSDVVSMRLVWVHEHGSRIPLVVFDELRQYAYATIVDYPYTEDRITLYCTNSECGSIGKPHYYSPDSLSETFWFYDDPADATERIFSSCCGDRLARVSMEWFVNRGVRTKQFSPHLSQFNHFRCDDAV